LNCLEFRRAVGAEPNRISADAQAHISECSTCAKYAQEMQRLDGLIKRALDVPAPQAGDFIAPAASPRRWYAMAASLIMTFVVGGIVWVGFAPSESIAADVVKHMGYEKDAMIVTDTRVSSQLLDGILQAKGMKLAEPLTDVSYARNCWIRRTWVPHVVVQTSGGPVAVIVLPNERVMRSARFEEGGYSGEIVPMGKGAIVIAATDAQVIDEVAEKVSKAIVWQ
jgi:hypothetical protein